MNVFRRQLNFALTFLGLSLGAVPAIADVPDYVKLRSIAFAGSGCPAGSVAANVSQDLTACR